MPDSKSRAARYRRHAQECLEMAYTVKTEEARATLLEMAQIWQRLADQQNGAPPLRAVEEFRPVVQQQQQIQPKNDEE
jgi:hypothetical protein